MSSNEHNLAQTFRAYLDSVVEMYDASEVLNDNLIAARQRVAAQGLRGALKIHAMMVWEAIDKIDADVDASSVALKLELYNEME